MPACLAVRAAGRCLCQARPQQQQQQQQRKPISSKVLPAFHKQAAAGLAAAALLLTSPAAALADSSSSGGGSGMTISFAPPSVKQALEARDEAMSYQCEQMFDCDGDRRDYAKKQWEGFVARGGVPERKVAAASPADSGAAPAKDAGSR